MKKILNIFGHHRNANQTVRRHFTSTGTGVINKTVTSVGKGEEGREHPHATDENIKWSGYFGKQVWGKFLRRVITELPHDPEIPREMNTYAHTKTCT